MSASVPTWWGVAASAVLVLIAMAVSMRDGLGLSRELAVVALRALVQLTAVGVLLGAVFRYGGLGAAAVWLIAMVVIGGQVAGRRAPEIPRARWAATASVGAGSGATLGVLLVLRIIPAEVVVVIPVGGMVVSGTMVASGITLRRVAEEARRSRGRIEARLALGLSAREAFAPSRREAVRTALMPALDSTKVVGLIALPGAMTGLILAGTEPIEAIRYQIVVMYMLLAAPAVSGAVAARSAQRFLFDDAHRLLDLPDGAGSR